MEDLLITRYGTELGLGPDDQDDLVCWIDNDGQRRRTAFGLDHNQAVMMYQWLHRWLKMDEVGDLYD